MEIQTKPSAAYVRISNALAYLRFARNNLADTDCPNAADAVRRAIRSAEGALRNQLNRDANPGRKIIKAPKGATVRKLAAKMQKRAALRFANGVPSATDFMGTE